MGSCLGVLSRHAEKEYVLAHIAKMAFGQTWFYAIFGTLSDELIGAIEIKNRSQFPGQLHCWLHEAFWGQGLFEQALLLA